MLFLAPYGIIIAHKEFVRARRRFGVFGARPFVKCFVANLQFRCVLNSYNATSAPVINNNNDSTSIAAAAATMIFPKSHIIRHRTLDTLSSFVIVVVSLFLVLPELNEGMAAAITIKAVKLTNGGA